MAEIISVHRHDGPDGAATEAGHGFERKSVILGRLACFDVQPLFEFLQNPGPAADVASRAQANLDEMLAARFQTEGPVEGDDAEDLAEGHVQGLGHAAERFGRKVVELRLDVQEKRDQVLAESVVLGDDGLDFLFVGQAHSSIVRGLADHSVIPASGRKAGAERRRAERMGKKDFDESTRS